MKKKLAIKGHQTKGKDVIEILKMLGGKDDEACSGKNPLLVYYIDDLGDIDFINDCNPNEDILRYTLEEFLEKYPYKIGDMVRVPEFESEVRIDDMKWDGYNIQYEVFTDETEWYTAEELNNWNTKKEPKDINQNPLLQQLKKYFEETPRDIIEKEWNELSYLNEIGPTVEEYLECVKKYRQTQYPKTVTECYNRLEDDELVNVKTIELFRELINARNAYWKIAGDWKPDWKGESWRQLKYCITVNSDGEIERRTTQFDRRIFAFPTEEMMNAFYENFKDKLEICKEFI